MKRKKNKKFGLFKWFLDFLYTDLGETSDVERFFFALELQALIYFAPKIFLNRLSWNEISKLMKSYSDYFYKIFISRTKYATDRVSNYKMPKTDYNIMKSEYVEFINLLRSLFYKHDLISSAFNEIIQIKKPQPKTQPLSLFEGFLSKAAEEPKQELSLRPYQKVSGCFPELGETSSQSMPIKAYISKDEKVFNINFYTVTNHYEDIMLFIFLISIDGLPVDALKQCPACNRWFVIVGKREKIYCSRKCATRANTKKTREKMSDTKKKKYNEEGKKRARISYARKLMKKSNTNKVKVKDRIYQDIESKKGEGKIVIRED